MMTYMCKKKRGVYQLSLIKTFIAISLCFLLCLGLLISLFILHSQRSSHQLAQQDLIHIQENLFNITSNAVLSDLNKLQESPLTTAWAESSSSNEYYLYTTRVYKLLTTTTINLLDIDYEINITQTRPNSLVLTPYGSTSQSSFFTDDSSSISYNTWQSILNYFTSHSKPFIYPVYENEVLTEIYYIVQQKCQSHNIIYLVKIPTSIFINANMSQEFILYSNENNFIASHSTAPKILKKLQANFNYIQSFSKDFYHNTHFTHGLYDLFIANYEKMGLYAMYQSKFPITILTQTFLLTSLLFLCFSIICILFFLKLSDRLYSPIRNVLSIIEPNATTAKPYDEFEYINANAKAVKTLNSQLELATKEYTRHLKQQYYHDLLYGMPSSSCPLTIEEKNNTYCVAIIEFNILNNTEKSDWDFHLQKSNLLLAAQNHYTGQSSPIYCINQGYNTVALILSTATLETAKHIIMEMINTIPLTLEIKIVLSNIYKGIDQIYDAYEQALRLLEYRYLIPNSQIITSDFIDTNTTDSYYYPLMYENRLIHTLAAGSPEALDMFDKLIDENLIKQTLSPHIKRNFIYALINSLLRVFQELKTTPQALLNQTIDVKWLYDNWYEKSVPDLIRKLLEDIIHTLATTDTTESDSLLQKMQDYIYKHYMEDIMLVDIADYCNISTSYCSSLFKKLSNDNFKTFLNHYRIEQACHILDHNPTTKILDLSSAVGFNSSNSFIRVFKQITGITPKAYAEKKINK